MNLDSDGAGVCSYKVAVETKQISSRQRAAMMEILGRPVKYRVLLPVLMATNLAQILCGCCAVSIVPAFTQCDVNANKTKQGNHWSLSFLSSRLSNRSQEPEVLSLKTDRPSLRSSWD